MCSEEPGWVLLETIGPHLVEQRSFRSGVLAFQGLPEAQYPIVLAKREARNLSHP